MQHQRARRPAACLLCLLLALPAAAGETVTLRNGFSLRVQGHERSGDWIRLVTGNGGWISVAAADVARIDPGRADEPADPQPRAETRPVRRTPALADEVDLQSARAGLPPSLVRAVVHAESGFRQDAVSAKGAIGLIICPPLTTNLPISRTIWASAA